MVISILAYHQLLIPLLKYSIRAFNCCYTAPQEQSADSMNKHIIWVCSYNSLLYKSNIKVSTDTQLQGYVAMYTFISETVQDGFIIHR